MDERVKTHIEPLLASPIVIKGGCRPCRIVMYHNERHSQYVVHMELLRMTTPKTGQSCAFEHEGFHQGGYYDYKSAGRPFLEMPELEARHNAEAEFKERSRKLY